MPFEQGLQMAALSVNPVFAAAAVGFSVENFGTSGRVTGSHFVPEGATRWHAVE
jgi:hypothetical protein